MRDIFSDRSGLDPFSGLDRNAFKDEDSYIAAAIEQELKFSDPRFQQARAKVIKMRQEQLEAEAIERERVEYEKAVKEYTLPAITQREIEKQAQAKAATEVGTGKYTPDRLTERVKHHTAELTKQAKETAVVNERMNQRIRKMMGGADT